MYTVGLTGGIGSGKTTVSDMFAKLGITIVDTDVIARQVVEPETPSLQSIAKHFGNSVLNSDGTLNRKYLRKIIFSQSEEKLWLENLLHPIIRSTTRQAIQESESPYTILSSPLLIESPDVNLVNTIAVVDIPESLQHTRTSARDNVSEEDVKRIIASQLSRQKRLDRANDIIDNSTNLSNTLEQVEKLHKKYLSEALKQT